MANESWGILAGRPQIPKEDLLARIEKCRGVVSQSKYNYLKSLINLETSALGNDISEEEKNSLQVVATYRKIVTYNISRRLKRLFELDDRLDVTLDGDSLKAALKEVYPEIFSEFHPGFGTLVDFNFSKKSVDFDLTMIEPKDSENGPLFGRIKIYRASLFEGARGAYILELERKKENLKVTEIPRDIGPYVDKSEVPFGNTESKYGYCNSDRAEMLAGRDERITALEAAITLEEGKTELSEQEKRFIDMSTKYHKLLLTELGLSDTEFESGSTSPLKQVSVLKKSRILINDTTYRI